MSGSNNLKTFSDTAVGLSRSPLGIIALFLVLIYGFACLLIGFGGPGLNKINGTPLVWFLTLFPPVVLFVFAYLVARHHYKLYPASDFVDGKVDSRFFITLAPPQSLPTDRTGIAVSGRDAAPTVDGDEANAIDAQYTQLLCRGYSILHKSEVVSEPTTPGSGFFRVRVWIEKDKDVACDAIESVTYRVWHDFPETKISTRDKGSGFDVWLNVNGEFLILACIKLVSGKLFYLDRYLDLPGRPQDP
jgi:hypothetical protein